MTLPEAPKAVGNYVTVKRAGNLIYTAGHIPIDNKLNLLVKFQVKLALKKLTRQQHYVPT